MQPNHAAMHCGCKVVLLILSMHWAPLGACYKALVDPPIWSSQIAADDDNEDPEVEGYEQKSAPEPAIARFLNSVQGDPKLLTLKELQELRKRTPSVVDDFVTVVNSERLAKDVKDGHVTPEQLFDLQNSLVFLHSKSCRRLKSVQSTKCLTISKPIHFPKDQIFSARLSGFVYPWLDINNIYLTVYIYYPREREFRGDVLHIRNVTYSSSIPDRRGFKGPSMDADINAGRQVIWDVTVAVLDLQRKQEMHSYPVYMVLNCPSDNCFNPKSSWQPSYEEDRLRDHRVLVRNSQAVLEIYTKPMVDLFNIYSEKLSNPHYPFDKPFQPITKRSSEDNAHCPSFLEEYSQQTKCCLFRFTLSKQQIESNDKLRFIVSPDRLPMNVCHGRCIGVDATMANSHSFLMNQYYAGLSDKEQNLIYEAMPCCSASKARNFTIVYIKRNGDLVTETLPNAIKEECSCN